MKGIDISSCNENIDFNAVRSEGIDVVIIKATEGVDFIDSCLEQNYNGANGVIPHIGFYHFMSERTNPSEQAEDFYNAIKDKNYDIKPCLDIETNNFGRSATEITDRCLEFINRFKELSGQDCMIYSGGYFAQDNLDERLANNSWLWIAHYGVDTPMIIPKWGEYVGHQYCENGSVNGINGDVDLDNFYDNGLMFLSSANETHSIPVGNENIVSQLQRLINEQGFGPVAVDGIPGEDTLAHCPLVREGAEGNITQWIQLRVGCNPDGIFGANTRDAIIGFQYLRGLVADGIPGENTWRELLGM